MILKGTARYLMLLGVLLLEACTADTFESPAPDAGASDAARAARPFRVMQPNDAKAIETDAASDGAIPETSKRIFVTSAKYGAALGGLAGADALCGSAASSAALGGQWRAWLSSSTQSASNRLVHSAVPYLLLGTGEVVAKDWAGLTSGALERAIDRDEYGTKVPVKSAWTSTQGTGLFSGNSSASACQDWTSSNASDHAACGSTSAAPDGGAIPADTWTLNFSSGCDATFSLYCVEQ